MMGSVPSSHACSNGGVSRLPWPPDRMTEAATTDVALRAMKGSRDVRVGGPASRWSTVPRRRDPGDVVRVAVGLVLLGTSAGVASQALPTSFQVNAFRLINELPPFVGPPLIGVMQLGALGAVPVLALIALLGRRGRLAPVLAGAGVGSWLAARVIQQIVDEDPPVMRVSRVVLHGALAPGFAFPATHVAIAAAMATVARGELGRPARRLAWLTVALVAVARVYVGAHLPVDVLGGFGVGWLVGGGVNLAMGVRPPVPDAANLIDLLGAAGRPGAAVRSVRVRGDGAARFVIETEDGLRMVKALGRDDPDADWLRRIWRFVAFRQIDRERTPVSAAHRVDHEAYATLLAQRSGVRVAPLVATWAAGGTELVERAWIPGSQLRDLAGWDPSVLQELWHQLSMLESVGLAHRVLPSVHVVVDGDGRPWIVELGDARVGATTDAIIRSRAAALADLAMVVGAPQAVDTLVASEGVEAATQTLPALQLVDLPAAVRRQLSRRPGVLRELLVEICALAGGDLPAVSRPVRVAVRNLVPLAIAAAAVFILLDHIGQAGTSLAALRHADPVALARVIAAAGLTYVCAALAVLAAAPITLRFGRTVAAQFGAASANRASPAGLGGMALNVRYLEMGGASRAAAGGAVALTSLSGFAVHAVMAVALVAVIGHRAPLALAPDLDRNWPLLGGLIATSTLLGLAVWYWRLHLRLARMLRAAISGAVLVAQTPWRLALLVCSSAGISLAYTAALQASVDAVGGSVTFTSALAVYLAAAAVGAVAPTPGGLGPLEAALVAGLSQQGVATAPAIAGVLAYRLLTYWLPVLPGLVCVGALKRRRLL